MARGKKRTTMAKLNRETRLRERRDVKEVRKAARKLASADDTSWLGEPHRPEPLGEDPLDVDRSRSLPVSSD